MSALYCKRENGFKYLVLLAVANTVNEPAAHVYVNNGAGSQCD